MSQADIARGVWSQEEHDLFLEALQLFPSGPWKAVAAHVGTRSVRQVQTHAQKYHEKVARRLRGLRKDRKRLQRPEHRIDDEMMEICQVLKRDRVPLSPRSLQFSTDAAPIKHRFAPSDLVHVITQDSDGEEETKQPELLGADTKENVLQWANVEKADAKCVIAPIDTHAQRKPPVPSFNDCIDYLMEVLSSSDSESESAR